jgi:hypothetical protein
VHAFVMHCKGFTDLQQIVTVLFGHVTPAGESV